MAKTRHVKNSEINSEALRAELKKRGLTIDGASSSIGRSHAYLSNALKTRRLPDSSIMLLKHMYNIDPEAYVIPEKVEASAFELEEKEPTSTVQNVELTFDSKRLYNLINNAVFNAIKRAFGEAEAPYDAEE